MATRELDLIVAGVPQKIAIGNIRSRDSNVLQRPPLVQSNNLSIRKQKIGETTMKRPTESLCDTESNSSRSSIQELHKPIIWVDIARKLPTPEVATPIVTATNQKLSVPVPIPNNPRQGLLPVAFQIYLQTNFSLMAEVETAKKRRSDNRHIFRTEQEDDVNWTSHAPRPSDWLQKPSFEGKTNRANKNAKLGKWLQLPDGLKGIHLQGREPRKTNPLQPGPRNLSKSIQHHSFDLPLEWVIPGTGTTLQPINLGKQTNRSRKRRRRTKRKTKKGKKLPKQLSSKGARGLRSSDSMLDENAFTGYDANSLSDSMREMDLGDGFPHKKLEDEQVLHEAELNKALVNDLQPPEVCGMSSDIKQQSLEDLEESLRNIQVQDEDINEDMLYQLEKTTIAEDMTWLYFPRAGNNFGARFELPIDLRKLKTMTPLEYLSQYVVATRCRQRLNDVVFERHATDSKLPSEKLFSSLTEILGFPLDTQAEDKLSNLIDLVSVSQLSREQFAGIGALAERIGRSGISRRDDLELADFNLLHQKMTYLEMDQLLRRLFMFICEIDFSPLA
ncbi:uncharacterized protein LOC130686945 [Daphnia carinata]|uniref:uncharacterized protein LOC130686945 n=1 Tax=Daphnia carinata TaxID=120202 RepID=UPI00257E3B53|nr:uncharacterized protein LOC130686945 [Daphnia carinata]